MRAAGPDVSIYTEVWGAIQDLHSRLYSRCFDRVALSNRPFWGDRNLEAPQTRRSPSGLKAFSPSPTEIQAMEMKPKTKQKTNQAKRPPHIYIHTHTRWAVCIQTQKEPPPRQAPALPTPRKRGGSQHHRPPPQPPASLMGAARPGSAPPRGRSVCPLCCCDFSPPTRSALVKVRWRFLYIHTYIAGIPCMMDVLSVV